MADKFRYSFDLTKEFEEQLKQGMLAAEKGDVTSSPGMMSADPPAQRLEEADQSKYDPYSFIKDYKDMLFSMFGGEEEYNKVIAEQDERLPKEEDALKKATGTYIGIIDLPPLPRVDTEKLEPYDKGEQPDVRKDVEETLQSIQIEETLNEVEKETSQQGLMSPLAPSESLRPKARPEVATGFNFKDTSIRLISDLMQDFNLTKTQAAALVGNLAWESDNYQGMQEYEPTVKGSRGGYGFAQWTGPRRKMFEVWSKENELDPNSYEANYGFLKFELSRSNDEIGSMGVNTIKKLKKTKDLDTAVSVVMNEYLRPGIPHEEKRKKRASQVLDLI